MLFNQRIIHNDNGTLDDLSRELNDAHEQTAVVDLAATDDFLYIGADLPFNHRFFDVSVANAVASVISVDVWDGSAWVACVDVVDQTAVSGACLARSGIISWQLPRTASWGKEESTEDMTSSGLTSAKVYDMYWARLKVSVSLTGTTALRYVGHKFADDADLASYYPDLIRSTVLDAFTTGKTTWTAQHVLAAEEIVRELRRARIIWSPNQLHNWEQFTLAAIHKAAEIIFGAFGEAYEEQRKLALTRYREQLSQGVFVVDRNESGRIDQREREPRATIVRR